MNELQYIKADPYPWPFNGNLTPQNTAFIVIDMQVKKSIYILDVAFLTNRSIAGLVILFLFILCFFLFYLLLNGRLTFVERGAMSIKWGTTLR